ncbi:hypothetical protein RXV94_10700 [Yeosuana sp. MJ-SS3]|uniref:Uncharacterized protein n=1 Tax=Gilvirhabdus luticola TaxID=3079858 RepID=A0ABU3U888_9FLAO|nr:hypothetical protein [Yeosuana sp. MJ-SS3]MDU8886630.1 hypothetical protein [Yeosuana sp. MJ-SS3]
MLGILFFLPVTFLMFLYPSTHNYNTLDIVDEKVKELDHFKSDSDEVVVLQDHLTVLGFFGKNPLNNAVAASNLKELIYDKFKGFKRFQIVIVVPEASEDEAMQLKKDISLYEDLKYWHFVYGNQNQIQEVFDSLKTDITLNDQLSTNNVFIVDKELSQRGRIDDRLDNEISKNLPIYGLSSYNCIEVAEIKNKMSEDLRILFTEYRQKRKGNFDSSSRRESDLKKSNEQN